MMHVAALSSIQNEQNSVTILVLGSWRVGRGKRRPEVKSIDLVHHLVNNLLQKPNGL
jgi:hypothetical protein